MFATKETSSKKEVLPASGCGLLRAADDESSLAGGNADAGASTLLEPAQSLRSRPRGNRLLYLLAHLALLSILVGCIHADSTSSSMPEFLGKKYKLSESTNFEEFMKALGVGLITRKMGAAVSPTVEVTKDDEGFYHMKTSSTFKTQELKFKLGEPFSEETPDGRTVTSTITLDGNKMTHVQKGEKNTTIERDFGPTEMKAIMKVDDIVCTRVYKLEN